MMEIQEQNKRTWGNDPQYFGSYFNMARLNIFSISNYLAEKFGITSIDDEEKIPISFLGDKDNKVFKIKQNQIFSNLVRYMPIARVFDFEKLPGEEKENSENNYGKDFKSLSLTFKIVFSEINEFRNDYTHYFSTVGQGERKLKVSDELKDFLNLNFIRAVLYTKDRFKDVFTDEDFEIASKTKVVMDDNTITQDGIVFLTSMFLDRENAFQFINKITGLKGTQTKGFKAKREVLMTFCVNLPHEKFISENTEQAFSLELINELNKCPKPLYNVISENEKKYFQPTLNDEQLDNVLQNSVPDSIEEYETYIESITKKVRNENRFAYFALKYIDQKELFEKYRFQINLGKIVIDEYPKQLNGKEETRTVVENAKAFGRLQNFNNEEEILKKINVGAKTYFEPFAPHYNFDAINNKIGIYSGKETTAKFITKETDRKIKFNLIQPLPEAFLSINELPKVILLEYLEKGKVEELINDFITLNNSKILNREFIETIKSKLSDFNVFYKRSQGRKEKSAYKKDTLKFLLDRKAKLNHILAEHDLDAKQIPTRILDYWLNIADVQSKTAISDRIKLMKRDCIDRLRSIDKNKAPKIGEMATFIAKDIVDMIIGKDKKQKITSFYYDKIQECLALYADNEKRELFIHICNNELKLNDDDGHPFLKNINLSDIKYTSDLYKKYIEEKGRKMVKELNIRSQKYVETDKSWLEINFYKKEYNEKLQKDMTVVVLPQDTSKIPFTLRQLEKERSTFDNWLEYVTKGKETNDTKKPVDLPTNLFNGRIEELIIRELYNRHIPFNEDANYNELFKMWWKHCRNDRTQGFYNSEREYTFENEKLYFNIDTELKFRDYIDYEFANKVYNIKRAKRDEERITNRRLPPIEKAQVLKTILSKIGSTEKEIRMLEEEDRLMLLMFEGLNGKELNLKLKEADKLLNESITVEQIIKGELSFNDHGENITNKDDRKIIEKSITETRKRKEFSVLKRFIFDRRLPELFEYFEEEDIPIEKIKIELDAYTKAKVIVFDKVFELEAAIIAKNNIRILELNKDKNGNIQTGYIPHKPYLFWLLENDIITEKEFKFMNMVRNTFSHNQFPQKKTMELFIPNWNKAKFAEQIVESYNKKIDLIITYLSNN